MDSSAVVEYMADWGYRTLPRHHLDSPGYSGLVVAIRPELTLRHYDPQRLSLTVRDPAGEADQRTFSWLTPGADLYRVCAGPITLRDRHGRAAEFFAFGGELKSLKGKKENLYEFRSPAPILELTNDRETVTDQLASEVEELMARARVSWNGDDEGFDQRLGSLDPVLFYAATVHSLLATLQGNDAMMKAYPELAALLGHEQTWLMEQGLWPADPPSLAELLSPERR